jgi:hypothetical protein
MASPETAKPATAETVNGLRNVEQLGGQLGKISTPSLSQDQYSRRDFVLAQLRGASLRVKLIDSEIAAIGTALKGGFITPDTALEWAEEMAPGCVGFVPDAVTPHGEAV